ncbi:MAG: gliding motility-associated C-terminal domain-containing protein [Marinifilaceae bacterium]
MRTFLPYWILFILFCFAPFTKGVSQVSKAPVAKNDTISITNQGISDEVVYVEVDFLKNDSFTDKSQINTKLLRQTLDFGQAYLIESNTLLVYYPYDNSFGTDTIYYEICNNLDQCDQASVIVTVLDPNKVDLIIPSAFSPNNDSFNNKFIIKGIENYPENELIVFSRWGTKVYQCKNYTNEAAWDGGYKNAGVKLGPGDKLPRGTYFYKLIIKDKKYVKSGYVVVKY